jgi:hypothetical protein
MRPQSQIHICILIKHGRTFQFLMYHCRTKNKPSKCFCVELLKSRWNVDLTLRAGLEEGLKVRDRTRNVQQRWHVECFTLKFEILAALSIFSFSSLSCSRNVWWAAARPGGDVEATWSSMLWLLSCYKNQRNAAAVGTQKLASIVQSLHGERHDGLRCAALPLHSARRCGGDRS